MEKRCQKQNYQHWLSHRHMLIRFITSGRCYKSRKLYFITGPEWGKKEAYLLLFHKQTILYSHDNLCPLWKGLAMLLHLAFSLRFSAGIRYFLGVVQGCWEKNVAAKESLSLQLAEKWNIMFAKISRKIVSFLWKFQLKILSKIESSSI